MESEPEQQTFSNQLWHNEESMFQDILTLYPENSWHQVKKGQKYDQGVEAYSKINFDLSQFKKVSQPYHLISSRPTGIPHATIIKYFCKNYEHYLQTYKIFKAFAKIDKLKEYTIQEYGYFPGNEHDTVYMRISSYQNSLGEDFTHHWNRKARQIAFPKYKKSSYICHRTCFYVYPGEGANAVKFMMNGFKKYTISPLSLQVNLTDQSIEYLRDLEEKKIRQARNKKPVKSNHFLQLFVDQDDEQEDYQECL